ncbi:carbohydrate diacid regulator [Caldalkalibacillus uzonensis]|uniref:Carbohydrate diacid regulator n=1 Tax=Caldalkalibacillus uzonensis TaxID=353224 RepID=A0ABU0CUG4_9BACI|nr:sugar diacid recognition domain-containing protein [Caldalkalibacillus uzonensis]MDQ0340057.1 carbohydrate diacid regulator [Caldalkalibacillus uzonensis]
MLTKEIARDIVKETMIRLNRNVNMMDHTGKIIASGDASRLNQIHEGAQYVLETGQPLIIQNPSQWMGALPGINLPVVFQGQIVGVIGITGAPDEIGQVAELVKMITEMMINQAFVETQLEWKQRMKEIVFHELIQPKTNYEGVDQRLNLLQIHLHPPFHVTIVEFGEMTMKSQMLIKTLEDLLDDKKMVTGFLGFNRLFILSFGLAELTIIQNLEKVCAFMKRMGIPLKMGLGSAVEEKEKIWISYEEARIALDMGTQDQDLISYADIETRALLSQIDREFKQKFTSRILGNLSPKALQTLEVFFSCNLNLAKTAKALYVHRNTLIYRLKKIKQDTGYDPQNFEDAVTLQIALWMRQ